MKSFIRNALDVCERDGGITPLRFTEHQLAFFNPTPYSFRSLNAAGVCLDFRTDSPFVHLSYSVQLKRGTSEHLHFDIYVDGRMTCSPGEKFTNRGSGQWTVKLPIRPGHPRRVTIYLPYMAKVTVHELTVADGAVREPVEPYKGNLLCFGDSITQGMNALHPSSTYPVQLARLLEMNLLNQAISGYVFEAGMLDSNLPYYPDLITVAYGTNDWTICSSLEQFRESAGLFLGKLAEWYPHVPLIVLSPLWRTDTQHVKDTGTFNEIHDTLRQLCTGYSNALYIDGLALTPHHSRYFADGLHPNDEGFLHMAMTLVQQLNTGIPDRDNGADSSQQTVGN